MYIYLGKYFHKSGKELLDLTEKKIGLTKSLEDRERNLNSTKFTIGYTFVRAWETADDTNKVEKSLHAILDDVRMDGEWFEDSNNSLISRVSKFMSIQGYPEVDLNDSSDEIEKKAIESTNTSIVNNVVSKVIEKLNSLSLQYEQRFDSDKNAPYFSIDINGAKVNLGMYSNGTKFYLYASGKKSTEILSGDSTFTEVSGKFRIGDKGSLYAEDLKDLFGKLEVFLNKLS